MPKRRDEVERGLLRKGFEKRDGDHHYFIYRNLSGNKTAVFTKTSHTPKLRELPDRLLSLMAKQCRLSKSDFSIWWIALSAGSSTKASWN